MASRVIVVFGQEPDFEYLVEQPSVSAQAREWLDQQYLALGAEPPRPSGKVLIADKILGVAAAAGPERFSSDPDWAQEFAAAAAGALDRDLVRVDVRDATIGY